ncbi:MAG: adenylate/guanylate cyclase domain-containing protein [Gammaproteobacteria bacterium]
MTTAKAQGCAILVADIVGSTRLYETLGDAHANRLITGSLTRMSDLVREYRGAIRTSAGDAVMCTFPAAADAAVVACEMQLAIQKEIFEAKSNVYTLRLRIGIHLDEAAPEKFDMLAESVKIARHVVDQAKSDQILITRPLYAALPGVYRAMTRYVDREPWRGGGPSHIDLYELIWEVDGLTAHATAATIAPQTGYRRVCLAIGGREHTIDESRPMLSVGRTPTNDMVVEGDLVSRDHFKIILRNGRCVLTDTSTNGTFIVADAGMTTPVMHESQPLRGSGLIHFGAPGEENAGYAIRYRCEA